MKNCNTIFLRALKSADIEYLARYSEEADFPFIQSRLSQQTISRPPSSLLEKSISQHLLVGFAIMDGADLVGQIHLSAFNLENKSCSITMGIAHRDNRNRGVGTCALTMALRYAFVSLGLKQVSTDTLSSNESAKQCLKNAGFQETGIEKNVLLTKRGFIHRHHFMINRQEFLGRKS